MKDVGPKADLKKLTNEALYGIDKKPMSYLLGMMNQMLYFITINTRIQINHA